MSFFYTYLTKRNDLVFFTYMYIIYKSKFLIMTTNFAYSVVQLLPADRIGSVMMYKIDFNKPCHIHFIGIGGLA